jgi:hypothetical protein
MMELRMKPTTSQIAARVAAGVLGGYTFVWGCATLGIALLLYVGMPYGDARTLVFLLAFVVLLIVFCWAFVAASLIRVWLVLAGGGAVMTGLAWLLTRTPVGA